MNRTRWQLASVQAVVDAALAEWPKVLNRAVELSFAHRMGMIRLNSPARSYYEPTYKEHQPLYKDEEVQNYEGISKKLRTTVSFVQYGYTQISLKKKKEGWETKTSKVYYIPNLEKLSVLEKLAHLGTGDANRYSSELACELAVAVLKLAVSNLNYYQANAVNRDKIIYDLYEYIDELAIAVGSANPLVYLPSREEKAPPRTTLQEKINRAEGFYDRSREERVVHRAVRRVECDFAKEAAGKNFWAKKLISYGVQVSCSRKLSDVLEDLAAEYRKQGK